MKIAVYTICKNEEQFIERWLDSCSEADYILVVDTGSTDGTVEKLRRLRETHPNLHFSSVAINPWRFDEARNFSLHSLPDNIDWCVCLDMDEILTEGWREKVEQALTAPGIREVEIYDRLRYNYVWSWNADQSPGVTYYADKIHRRHGLRWVHPVHEVLVKDSRLGQENQKYIDDTLIEHYPDMSKSRSNYLPLLALSVKEAPHDDRNAHYYARELFFNSQYEEAIEEFKRHLELKTAVWASERSASWRYMGDCYWALQSYSLAIDCFKQACKEVNNTEREPLLSLAQAFAALSRPTDAKITLEALLRIKERPNSYINQPSAWSSWPEELLARVTSQIDTNT